MCQSMVDIQPAAAEIRRGKKKTIEITGQKYNGPLLHRAAIKTEMLRRNGLVVKSVQSVLRLEGSLWWERFVKEVGLEPGVKERGNAASKD